MKVRKAQGVTVSFRLVEESDAEFILSLRLDPELGRYMSPTDPSVEKQREWIAEYKKREAAGRECYYIVLNGGKSCGAVKMILPEGKDFEWGSFILNADKTPTAGIETAIFIYQIGFDLLNFERSLFTVHKENIMVVSFHRRTGARIIGERETVVGRQHLFEFNRGDWERLRKKFGNLLVKTFE